MTIGVGGGTQEEALGRLRHMLDGVEPIAAAEYQARIDKAQERMRHLGLDAVFLSAGANLEYFTGVRWSPSERMVGALLPANGALQYLAPAFEQGTIRDFMVVEGTINGWQEHESPYRLLLDCLQRMGIVPNTSLPADRSLPVVAVLHVRWPAPARSRLRVHRCKRGDRLLPATEISRRAGADAAGQGHDAGRAQGRREHSS